MTPQPMCTRIRAVLDHDRIPKHRQAAHLREACGVSKATARRLLSGKDCRGHIFWKLADGLDVCARWLWRGDIDRPHPRTLRIDAEHIRGYSPADAGKLARFTLAIIAGHRRANNLMDLATAGQLSLVKASRLL